MVRHMVGTGDGGPYQQKRHQRHQGACIAALDLREGIHLTRGSSRYLYGLSTPIIIME